MKSEKIAVFRKTVRRHFKKNGRHTLPWRKTRDPYRILVSEIMLQQTQVDRVVPFYRAFLKRFPTVPALAKASLGDVLRAWQGLGYNRRAKMLHDAAKAIVSDHGGKVPRAYEELLALPGIGPYTARAVRTFAWDESEAFIETNIRAVFIHHFFPRKKKIIDAELLKLIGDTLDRKKPREWYWALMDYGSKLKRTVPNPSRRSRHHLQQKPFKGSDREVRGAILRELGLKSLSEGTLMKKLPFEKERTKRQIEALFQEGLIARSRKALSLP